MVQSLMEVVKETDCASGKVECELSWRDAELVIVVRDPGPGFDPLAVPNPVAEENLCSSHGRGIYLIRQLVDDVWFERAGSEIHIVGSNRTTVEARQPGPSHRPDSAEGRAMMISSAPALVLVSATMASAGSVTTCTGSLRPSRRMECAEILPSS
jgi:hypothetical protein